MKDLLDMKISKNEQEEIKKFISTLLLLPKEDRAMLLFSENAFKVRSDIVKTKCSQIEAPQRQAMLFNFVKRGDFALGIGCFEKMQVHPIPASFFRIMWGGLERLF